jgi:hypothetical protein
MSINQEIVKEPVVDAKELTKMQTYSLLETINWMDPTSSSLSDKSKKDWALLFKPYDLENYAHDTLNSFECFI